MFNFDEKFRLFAVLVILIEIVIGSPLYYKKMDGDTYEPGKWITSSTSNLEISQEAPKLVIGKCGFFAKSFMSSPFK